MKFSTREDIAAPIDYVFGQVSNFTAFERSAMRRGAEVLRMDTSGKIAPGLAWEISFGFRGKPRDVRLELMEYEPEEKMCFEGKSSGLIGVGEVELLALSPKKTRMRVAIELKPQTLSARLLVQSLKLAKGNVDKKFQLRVADYASELGARYSMGKTA